MKNEEKIMEENRKREEGRMRNNFSFVIPQRLAGMRYPGTEEDIKFIKEQGISAIVTLTEDTLYEPYLKKYGMEWIHIPIQDFYPPRLSQVLEFVEFIEKMNEKKKAVVVHCHAGIGRTGTMLACYLVRLGRHPEEAIMEIRELRPGSIETEDQAEIVYQYAQFLKEEKEK